jgi:hypothetical protein
LAIHSFIKGWLLSQIASSSSLGEILSNLSLGSLFLSFGSSKEKNYLLLVWSLMASGVENREESFPFGKLFLSFAWF